jgi:glycoprotein-N-acetylgalactosamine 3-beta-galactosyltransferase
MRLKEFHFFAIGFLIGSFVILVPFFFYNDHRATRKQKFDRRLNFHEESEAQSQSLFNETLSNLLYKEVKILCMVMTHPKNHRTKAIHIKNTWGHRCNKLIFMSSELDLMLDTVVLPIQESRESLWNKTRASFQYVYEHHGKDYDFFMKADDDK